MMRGIIYGNTLEVARERLDKLIDEYLKFWKIDTKQIRKSQNEYVVIFTNGDIWRAVLCHDRIRGVRCNIALVDNQIPKIMVDCIIRPCITHYPFGALGYYNSYYEEEI